MQFRFCRIAQPCDEEDCDGDEEGGHRSVHHIADVDEEVRACGRRGKDGCIAQGRHLIAEVGTGDDGTCRPGLRDSKCMADTQQGDADGGNGGPRTA